MQALPLLPLSEPRPLDRPSPISSKSPLRTAAARLAQKVALSVTASLIAMGGQYQLSKAFRTPPVPQQAASIAPADAAPAVARQTSERAALLSILGETDVRSLSVKPGDVTMPSRPSAAARRQEPRARTSVAMIPLPPPRPRMPAAMVEPVERHGAGHVDGVVEPIRLADSGMRHPERDTIPVPPPRPAVDGQEPSPVKLAAASIPPRKVKLPAIPVPRAFAPPVLEAEAMSSHAPSGDRDGSSMIMAPMRYGMRLAGDAGDFAMAANHRLLASTGDAIALFTR